VRQFKPKMVALRDSSKVAQLKELIKDLDQQPEILVRRTPAALTGHSLAGWAGWPPDRCPRAVSRGAGKPRWPCLIRSNRIGPDQIHGGRQAGL
jgi:hypothetical protein